MKAFPLALIVLMLTGVAAPVKSQSAAPSATLTFVELNCENLFDTRHDEGKGDAEFVEGGLRNWNDARYWRKLNHIGQAILSCSEDLPDLVALCEVENDSVMCDLTRRSLLRNAGYEYLMTESPDERGIDVALLYQPSVFRVLCYETLEVPLVKGMRPTRDLLYIKGVTRHQDTLHVFVVHAPSRYGGELETRPFRCQVANMIVQHLGSLEQRKVIVAGDFNDYYNSSSLQLLEQHGLVNLTRQARGRNNRARGTYRYRGQWRSIDHVMASPAMAQRKLEAFVNDDSFLLEEEPRYGGVHPRRTYSGLRYQRGFSDHLPLVVKFAY